MFGGSGGGTGGVDEVGVAVRRRRRGGGAGDRSSWLTAGVGVIGGGFGGDIGNAIGCTSARPRRRRAGGALGDAGEGVTFTRRTFGGVRREDDGVGGRFPVPVVLVSVVIPAVLFIVARDVFAKKVE